MGGWGNLWGLGWGGGQPLLPFELLSALPVASNRVRVTFSVPPAQFSPAKDGDCLRPSYWSVSRTDKSEQLVPLAVLPSPNDLNSLDVVVMQRWASSLAQYSVAVSGGVLSAAGQSLVPGFASASFFGLPPTFPTKRVGLALPVLDLAGPKLYSGSGPASGLRVGSNGDYMLEAAPIWLKKVIERELFIRRGEFAHLADTDFGLGLRSKNFYRAIDLVALQVSLEKEVAANPEVVESNVDVELLEDGQLRIHVRAKTNFGPLDQTFVGQ
jgi:hypothetical protein